MAKFLVVYPLPVYGKQTRLIEPFLGRVVVGNTEMNNDKFLNLFHANE